MGKIQSLISHAKAKFENQYYSLVVDFDASVKVLLLLHESVFEENTDSSKKRYPHLYNNSRR